MLINVFVCAYYKASSIFASFLTFNKKRRKYQEMFDLIKCDFQILKLLYFLLYGIKVLKSGLFIIIS